MPHPNDEIEIATQRACELLEWTLAPEHHRPGTLLLAVEKLGHEIEALRAERNTYLDKLRTQGTMAARRVRVLEAEIEALRAAAPSARAMPTIVDASVPRRAIGTCRLCGGDTATCGHFVGGGAG